MKESEACHVAKIKHRIRMNIMTRVFMDKQFIYTDLRVIPLVAGKYLGPCKDAMHSLSLSLRRVPLRDF